MIAALPRLGGVWGIALLALILPQVHLAQELRTHRWPDVHHRVALGGILPQPHFLQADTAGVATEGDEASEGSEGSAAGLRPDAGTDAAQGAELGPAHGASLTVPLGVSWSPGSLQALGRGMDGIGGWGGVVALSAQWTSKNKRWAAETDLSHWRVAGATPGWLEWTRLWGWADGIGRGGMTGRGHLSANRWTGSLAFQVSPSVELEVGHGAHHWGNGWRSLWWDRQAAPLPYLRLHADVGRAQYTHTVARTRHWRAGGPPNVPGWNPQDWEPWQTAQVDAGWLAAHQVTVDLGRGFQGTLFGAVKWLGADTAHRMRLEPAYWIPVTAFRPTEYALGSADNALVGAAGKWAIDLGPALGGGGFSLAGQILLDEWVTSQIRARTGWWANKWGALATARWWDGRGRHAVVAEWAQVRPYTYSHGAPGQAWTHDRTPLGHPAGANFVEGRIQAAGLGLPAGAKGGTWSWRLGGTWMWQGVDDWARGVEDGRAGVWLAAEAAAGENRGTVGSVPWVSYLGRPEDYGVDDVYGGDGRVPGAGTVKTWRVWAEGAWAAPRLSGGEVFVRAAGRWAAATPAGGEVGPEPQGSATGRTAWKRFEIGIRFCRTLEERDW
ncbi:MAG: hypothetical protein RJA19_1195 [Bacteroidota bacterium]